MATIAQRVFGVTELLEGIILHLDFPDILYNAQRVNKSWKGCIEGSLHLQKLCWFHPIPMADDDPDPHFALVPWQTPCTPECDKDCGLHLHIAAERQWITKQFGADLGRRQMFQGLRQRFVAGDMTSLHYHAFASYIWGPCTRDYERRYGFEDLVLTFKPYICNINGGIWGGHDKICRNHLHPLLRGIPDMHGVCVVGYGDDVSFHMDVEQGDTLITVMLHLEALAGYGGSHGPWKQYMLMRPACRTLGMTVWYTSSGELHRTVQCHNDRGVTVCDFYKAFYCAVKWLMLRLQYVKEDWAHIERRAGFGKGTVETKVAEWTQHFDTSGNLRSTS